VGSGGLTCGLWLKRSFLIFTRSPGQTPAPQINEIPKDFIAVYADASLLRRVFQNDRQRDLLAPARRVIIRAKAMTEGGGQR
jgi:hypothetical protein